ncbi:MAG TPA: GDSL-type esterase/lipase family protein, partial [Pyrinomonadaceae bacterium]
KVNGTQVVGAQGYKIADPEATVESNTEAIKELLTLLRNWGAVGTLSRSTLNDSLISLWMMNNVNDSHGSNHLTNNGAVTFDSAGANFSGLNHLSVANNSTLDPTTYQSFTYAARFRLNSKATTQSILSKTDGASANEYALNYVSAADGFDRFRWNVYPGGNTQVGVTASSAGAPSAGVDYLVVAWYDAQTVQACIQVNGGTADCTSVALIPHPYTSTLAIGATLAPGAALRLNGSVRFVGFWGKALTSEERAELYENQAVLSYPLKDETTARLEHVIQPYSLFDSRAPAHASAQPGGFTYALPYSRAIFTTAATSMDVQVYTSNNEALARGRSFNVRVNGADYALVEAPQSSSAVATLTVALPAGQKTVEVWSGTQFLQVTTLVGTWLRKVTFNAPAQIKAVSNRQPHLVAYGDSITVGDTREGWTMLLRDVYPGSVALEAWGGRSLVQDAPNAPARATLVNQIATQSPDVIWLGIGTNDYGGVGFGEQSAASFGTAYAALLDELHVARPTAAIYAQSMTPRANEAANNYGNTLPQYRSQVQTACAARPWCNFVDGTAIPGWSNATDLTFDGVHLSTAGNQKAFNYFRTFLGL